METRKQIFPRELRTADSPTKGDETATMFAFFSNRLGCLGSIAVSLIGTVILIFLMRGCH
ncbi:MAG: hypothetical protein QOH88_553 [Verrucomicrobiota bacterium]|jgi:hypothetical protein